MKRRLRSIVRSASALPGGRRTKFATIGVWGAIAVAIGPLSAKFEDAQSNAPADYLPAGAESIAVLEELDRLPSGDISNAVTVLHRGSGLLPADRIAIERARRLLNESRRQGVGFTAPTRLSADGRTALLVTPIAVGAGTNEVAERLVDTTDEIKDRLAGLPAGLESKVTGPAGLAADSAAVFDRINGTLLLAAAAIVLVLLIAIYRSPIFWLIPFAAVLLAEVTSRGLGYLIAEAGVAVNSQAGGILPILVFGAGTDYALLIVSRYREELREHEDKHEAITIALRRTAPAVIASAGTVIAAMLTLSLAEVQQTAGLGPIAALGIALAMISMLTVLPALLALCGRRAFWPFVPRVGDRRRDERRGLWRGIGEWIARGPRRVWVGTATMLALIALGLLQLNGNLTAGEMFRGEVDAVRGQALLEAAFPAGTGTPTEVIVTNPKRVAAVRKALASAPGVARVRRRESLADRTRIQVTLAADPFTADGFDLIPGIRGAVRAVASDDVLVGGPSAEEHDLRRALARDNRVIVPIALAVVLLILVLLLRTLVAPLLLIGSVVLSFAAALGIGAVVSETILGFPGIDPSLPLYSFVFLIALGIDYNIFLIARVREESLAHGTHRGTIRGLAATGAVISSAGLVLAGTFSALAVLPLVPLTQIGLTVAIGLLLDTFLVRTLLVPALVLELGDRVWWPSALGARLGRRQESVRRVAQNPD